MSLENKNMGQAVLGILMAGLLALSGWTLSTINAMGSEVAVLKERVATIQTLISTGILPETQRELDRINFRVEKVEASLESLTNKVNKLYSKSYRKEEM